MKLYSVDGDRTKCGGIIRCVKNHLRQEHRVDRPYRLPRMYKLKPSFDTAMRTIQPQPGHFSWADVSVHFDSQHTSPMRYQWDARVIESWGEVRQTWSRSLRPTRSCCCCVSCDILRLGRNPYSMRDHAMYPIRSVSLYRVHIIGRYKTVTYL